MILAPRLRLVALIVSLGSILQSASASATPASMCTGTHTAAICDLYGTGIGTPVFVLGNVSPGVVDIYAYGGVPRTGQLLFGGWDGANLFLDPTIVGAFVQLLRDGCASGVAGDQSCFFPKPFPGPDIVEDASGFAVYSPASSQYRIHPVPEPAAVALVAASLAGIVSSRRRAVAGAAL